MHAARGGSQPNLQRVACGLYAADLHGWKRCRCLLSALVTYQSSARDGTAIRYGREIHYFREEVHLRRVVGQWIPTKFQIADIFTKNLDPTTFYRHRDKLLVGKEL